MDLKKLASLATLRLQSTHNATLSVSDSERICDDVNTQLSSPRILYMFSNVISRKRNIVLYLSQYSIPQLQPLIHCSAFRFPSQPVSFTLRWSRVNVLCQLCLHACGFLPRSYFNVFISKPSTSLSISESLFLDLPFPSLCSFRFHPCFTLSRTHNLTWALDRLPPPPSPPLVYSSLLLNIESWIYYANQNRAMTLCPRRCMSLV